MPTSLTYHQLREQRICVHCHSKPSYQYYVNCKSCMERARMIQKRFRNKRKEQGLCQRCYVQPTRKGFTYCEKCRKKKSRWAEFRQPCKICGFEYSDVHHIDKNKQNNKPENLVSLCPNHHRLLHWNKLDADTLKRILP